MTTIHVERTANVRQLKEALRISPDDAQKTRIRAIIKLVEGATKTKVAEDLTIGRTSLIEWVKCYNDGGVKALVFSKGGRPLGDPKWSEDMFINLATEIDTGGYWSIPRMRQWLNEHYHVDIPEQTVWYRMDKLGYSYKSARPHPVKGDKERQETFKKGVSLRFWQKE